MPASIAHMLIARSTRAALRQQGDLNGFLELVLDRCPVYMELGALGPDLPYFGELLRGAYNTFLSRSDKPLGVDQWSYQLHSKEPNIFPLKLLEITWKEAGIDRTKWESVDHRKFAFTCGYLTHMAADQVIHPIVNRLAGSYCKTRAARQEHRTCEIHQDVYTLARHYGGQLPVQVFKRLNLDSWCIPRHDGLWTPRGLWFRYFLQKAFVEAHAVTPDERQIGRWLKGTGFTLRHFLRMRPIVCFGSIGPYGTAYKNLIDGRGQLRTRDKAYCRYIALEGLKLGKAYDDYLAAAVTLSCIYVRAAYKVYCAGELDDRIRAQFLAVVQNADLGTPLERDVLAEASDAMARWSSGQKGIAREIGGQSDAACNGTSSMKPLRQCISPGRLDFFGAAEGVPSGGQDPQCTCAGK